MRTMSDTMKQDKNKEKQAGLGVERPLPEPFRDLEPYLAWSLPTDRERSAKRQSGTMVEINAFYHAMLPRMDEILAYLEQYPPEQVPAEVQRLFFLTLSLAKIAPAVEMYGEPNAEGLDALRLVNVDIYPTRS
jgi:hypothetical protein